MDYFPFFFDLREQPVVLIGGGQVALRKARLLAKAGAAIRLISPVASDELQQLVVSHGGSFSARNFELQDLQDTVLVICATNDATVNQQVSIACKARRIPVNVVDSPELCTVITPAIIDRNPLIIAISSGGAAPVLARKLKQRIETLVPSSIGQLAQFCRQLREKVKAALPESQRRYFWEKFLASPAASLAQNGQQEKAQSMVEQQLANIEVEQVGEVYLVGAGPGAPDLLTLRALQLMQQADVVLYDRLVSAPILDLVRRDADRIYVGKKRADHSLPQQEINQLLVDLAQQGKKVLRLKGGDPFIFGRGGEEIELLSANRIPFEVVPGITAASGCASYAGIPLTHRDYAQSVRFITGHLKGDETNIRWTELVAEDQTLVFYMSLQGLSAICNALISHGKSPTTQAALIEKGTLPEQRVFLGNLTTLPEIVERNQVQAPTLLIIGGVVGLHTTLAWYQSKADSDY